MPPAVRRPSERPSTASAAATRSSSTAAGRWRRPRSDSHLAAGELPVEAEGDVVGHLGSCQLVELLRVEDQQEGALRPAVEDDRQEDTLILLAGARLGHEDRLAG